MNGSNSTANKLTTIARSLLSNLLGQLLSLDGQIAKITKLLVEHTKQVPACRELVRMPGVGWLVAGALYVRIGNGSAFGCGRDVSASIGSVPGHTGTGAKTS